jgi:hypothetical protein
LRAYEALAALAAWRVRLAIWLAIAAAGSLAALSAAPSGAVTGSVRSPTSVTGLPEARTDIQAAIRCDREAVPLFSFSRPTHVFDALLLKLLCGDDRLAEAHNQVGRDVRLPPGVTVTSIWKFLEESKRYNLAAKQLVVRTTNVRANLDAAAVLADKAIVDEQTALALIAQPTPKLLVRVPYTAGLTFTEFTLKVATKPGETPLPRLQLRLESPQKLPAGVLVADEIGPEKSGPNTFHAYVVVARRTEPVPGDALDLILEVFAPEAYSAQRVANDIAESLSRDRLERSGSPSKTLPDFEPNPAAPFDDDIDPRETNRDEIDSASVPPRPVLVSAFKLEHDLVAGKPFDAGDAAFVRKYVDASFQLPSKPQPAPPGGGSTSVSASAKLFVDSSVGPVRARIYIRIAGEFQSFRLVFPTGISVTEDRVVASLYDSCHLGPGTFAPRPISGDNQGGASWTGPGPAYSGPALSVEQTFGFNPALPAGKTAALFVRDRTGTEHGPFAVTVSPPSQTPCP